MTTSTKVDLILHKIDQKPHKADQEPQKGDQEAGFKVRGPKSTASKS